MPFKLRGASAVRRRPITNGNGAGTPSSGLPLNGGGAPLSGGGLAVGQGTAPSSSIGAGSSSGLPVPVTLPRGGGPNRAADPVGVSGSSPGGSVRKGSRLALSNWRVRWRLFALIAVPTVTALVLGIIQSVDADASYNNYARVQTLERLGGLATTAVGQLEDERDQTAGFIAENKSDPALLLQVKADQAAVNSTLAQFQSLAGPVYAQGSAYPDQVKLDLNNAVQGISDLQVLRLASESPTNQFTAARTIDVYDTTITDFITFVADVSTWSSNVTLENSGSVLATLLRITDDASIQRAHLYQALLRTPPALTPTELSDLNGASEQQQADQSVFNSQASVTEQQTYENVVSGQQVDEAKGALTRATTSATGSGGLTIG